MVSVKAINNTEHRNVRVKSNPSFLQSKDNHFVPIVAQEFVTLSKEFPIVFVKDTQTGVFNSVALLGLAPRENLFYAKDSWRANSIPQLLSFYPFLLHREPSKEQAVLCIDEDSPLVNSQEGEKLFDDQGQQMDWLSKKANALLEHIENRALTQKLIEELLNKNLLHQQTLSINLPDQPTYDLNGLYTINEEQLNRLSESEFRELRASGILPLIYAVLFSMQCMSHLTKRKNKINNKR